MRARVVLSSSSIQMLSPVATMAPGAVELPRWRVAVTLADFASILRREASPQEIAHSELKAEVIPPQGFFTPAMGSAGLLVFASTISMRSGPGIYKEPAKKTHSGLAGAGM